MATVHFEARCRFREETVTGASLVLVHAGQARYVAHPAASADAGAGLRFATDLARSTFNASKKDRQREALLTKSGSPPSAHHKTLDPCFDSGARVTGLEVTVPIRCAHGRSSD